LALGDYNIFTSLHIPLIALEVLAAMAGIIGAYAIIHLIRSRGKKDKGPISTLDEFDKPGYIHLYEIDRELEGASFLTFERSNGELVDRQIGQPFTFLMENGTIERHHLNARGSYRCIDPEKLFLKYIANAKKELTKLAHLSEQHIRTLRTGNLSQGKLSRHLRLFILLFLLAGMIGIGLAAATVHHP
jgi:hypothetical protein